ncbi:MAG TPA: carboxymuconolactone decarboxylase family protein [Verrucomicrobiae bacterium]|jgi:4-carboxymuconolactone decarboxylase|nr:carboxymuconolactone decarboxylase family protein [Verrucomicrobiae bacterium]
MTNDKAVLTTRERIGDVAPKLADLTEKVLFGDIWERPGLSKRDRSVITVSALVAMNRTEQLPFHLSRALENGVTKDELVELITHLAFYSGWPTAMSAMGLAKEAFRGSADSK